MKVAVEGCCHGELDKIYETLEYLEKRNGIKVDLLLICGDFQAVRNKDDLHCMAVPKKYQQMNTFYKYYSGEKKAPVLTVFIGGNHEASNYLQELPYGGWVAPNIYYMGYANLIKFGGIRIGGLSGIFKGRDYCKGHYEHPPYNEDSKRSAYHVRNLEVFRLKQISRPIDLFMSHDWPRGVYNYGDVAPLLKLKSYFRDEIENNTLGSPMAEELLHYLKPSYWFSAHLHCKFAAVIQHQADDSGAIKNTRFLALDKCLPRRKFLQVIDIPHDSSQPLKLQLDPEWVTILKSTNHLLNLSPRVRYMPGPGSEDRWDFKVTQEEINSILEDFGGDMTLPENFETTVPVYDPSSSSHSQPPTTGVNPQTTLLCTMLEITDPNAVFLGKDSHFEVQPPDQVTNPDEIDLDSDAEDDTEYESEPSFISLSGSEQSFSFLSASNDSILSVDNPLEITAEEEDVQDMSLSRSCLTISDDDEEFQEILAQQLKAKAGSVESEDSSLSQTTGSDRLSAEESDSDILEILSAQKVFTGGRGLSTTNPIEISYDEAYLGDTSTNPLELSADDEEEKLLEGDDDELREILLSQVKHQNDTGNNNVILRPVSHSSPTSADRGDDENLPVEKSGQKRTDLAESEESPQSKKLKRRNKDLYSEPVEDQR